MQEKKEINYNLIIEVECKDGTVSSIQKVETSGYLLDMDDIGVKKITVESHRLINKLFNNKLDEIIDSKKKVDTEDNSIKEKIEDENSHPVANSIFSTLLNAIQFFKSDKPIYFLNFREDLTYPGHNLSNKKYYTINAIEVSKQYIRERVIAPVKIQDKKDFIDSISKSKKISILNSILELNKCSIYLEEMDYAKIKNILENESKYENQYESQFEYVLDFDNYNLKLCRWPISAYKHTTFKLLSKQEKEQIIALIIDAGISLKFIDHSDFIPKEDKGIKTLLLYTKDELTNFFKNKNSILNTDYNIDDIDMFIKSSSRFDELVKLLEYTIRITSFTGSNHIPFLHLDNDGSKRMVMNQQCPSVVSIDKEKRLIIAMSFNLSTNSLYVEKLYMFESTDSDVEKYMKDNKLLKAIKKSYLDQYYIKVEKNDAKAVMKQIAIKDNINLKAENFTFPLPVTKVIEFKENFLANINDDLDYDLYIKKDSYLPMMCFLTS